MPSRVLHLATHHHDSSLRQPHLRVEDSALESRGVSCDRDIGLETVARGLWDGNKAIRFSSQRQLLSKTQVIKHIRCPWQSIAESLIIPSVSCEFVYSLYGECMVGMISTTVRLNAEDVHALKRARAAGHSASELLRKGLRVVASRYYTAQRPASMLLFESTDTKLGDGSELFRDLKPPDFVLTPIMLQWYDSFPGR